MGYVDDLLTIANAFTDGAEKQWEAVAAVLCAMRTQLSGSKTVIISVKKYF